jgi:hypothetical protein
MAVFTFPSGAVVAVAFSPKLALPVASSAFAAIAQPHTTQTAKTNRTLRLLKELLSRPNLPANPKSTLLTGNGFCVEFMPGDSATTQAEGKQNFDFRGRANLTAPERPVAKKTNKVKNRPLYALDPTNAMLSPLMG